MRSPPGRLAPANLVPIGDIVAGLAASAESLCRKLLPGGVRRGDEWTFAGKDSRFGCSGQVKLAGPKRGTWIRWVDHGGGDALDLVAELECNGDKKQAVAWAIDWLGGTIKTSSSEDARKERERRAQAEKEQAQREQAGRTSAAFRQFLDAQPRLAGTPAETYLCGRGIDLAALGGQPRALRYAPCLKHPCGQYFPAIIAAIVRPNANGHGRLVAVHRTFLAPDGRGKAPIPPDENGKPGDAKMSLGPKGGGLIPLWRGAGGRPLSKAAPGETIVLSEGIEDGLTCVLAAPEYRVASAIDLGNMGAIVLPAAIGTVIIAAQNDPWFDVRRGDAHGARLGLDRAIRNFQRQGKEVRLARPAEGKDMNDLLRGVA